MTEQFLGDRRKALEDAFFTKEDHHKLRALRAAQQKRATVEELQGASGLSDVQVLGKLAEIGLTGETIAALSLVPLVTVAWADDGIQDAEKAEILEVGHAKGIERGTPAHEMLASWLGRKPPEELFNAWHEYVRAVVSTLPEGERERLKEQVLDLARSVAGSAGGYLGLGRISRLEEHALQRVAAAFDA